MPPPLQAIEKPANKIAAAVNRIASVRFRRSENGTPSNTAPNTTILPLHGDTGAWFAALAFAVMMSTVLPFPPLVRATEGALAETFEAVPLAELTLVANETVPA